MLSPSGRPGESIRPALVVGVLLLLLVPAGPAIGAPPASPRGGSLPVDQSRSTGHPSAPAPDGPGPLVRGGPWVNRTAALGANAPSARQDAQIALDSADGYVVLFGGQPNRGGGPLRDTWVFQNGVWTNLTSSLSVSPPGRYGGMMAYDPFARNLVLYGGFGSVGLLSDTWTFSSGAWTQVFPLTVPGARAHASVAFDGTDGYLLMFGGQLAAGALSNSTWEFHAGDWSNLSGRVAGSPPPMSTAAAAYDPSLSAVLLFGGAGARGDLNGTWTYANRNWTNRSATSGVSPESRDSEMLAYDAADGFDLLYGGRHGLIALNDNWQYLGGKWSKLALPTTPPPRFLSAMAYSSGPGLAYTEIVLFGGRVSLLNNVSALSDTWTFKVPLTGNVTLAPSAIDRGQAATVTVHASGGIPPYSVSWPALPANCVGVTVPGHFNCAPGIPGQAVFVAEITDSANESYVVPSANLTVAEDPTLSASVLPSIGRSPLAVQFTATVSGGTRPFAFEWEFGDGQNSSIGNASHTYAAPGTYYANLSLSDAAGMVDFATPVTVRVGGPLLGSAHASVDVGTAPLTVAFVAGVSGGLSPFSYNWSFGTGQGFSSDPNPSYTFSTAGNYTVRLREVDALSDASTAQLNVTVFDPVDADFQASFPGGVNCSTDRPVATLQLLAIPSGGVGPYNESWYLAGATTYGLAPAVSLVGGVGITVRLTVTDARGSFVTISQGITAPTETCPGAAPPGGPTTYDILLAILGLLVLIVAIEALIVLGGRRNRAEEEEEVEDEEPAAEPPPPPK